MKGQIKENERGGGTNLKKLRKVVWTNHFNEPLQLRKWTFIHNKKSIFEKVKFFGMLKVFYDKYHDNRLYCYKNTLKFLFPTSLSKYFENVRLQSTYTQFIKWCLIITNFSILDVSNCQTSLLFLNDSSCKKQQFFM